MNHAKSQVTKFSGLYRRSQFASTPASSNALISEYMQKSAMQLNNYLLKKRLDWIIEGAKYETYSPPPPPPKKNINI